MITGMNDLASRGTRKYERYAGIAFTESTIFEKRSKTSIWGMDSFGSSQTVDDVLVNEMRNLNSKFAHFGGSNTLHLELLRLISGNSILGELLNTKAKLIRGRKVIAYREVDGEKVEIKDGPVAEFFAENDIQELMFRFAMDLAYTGNIYPEYVFNRKGDKINALNHLQMPYCRTSLNRKWVGHGNWNRGYPDPATLKLIPIFNYRKFRQGKTYRKAAEHFRFYFPFSTYYGFVNYLFARIWIEYANKVPESKLASLLRSSKLKYHIEYPEKYFEERFPATEINPDTGKNYGPEDWDKIEKAVHLKIDQQLSNIEESEATLMTAIRVDYHGREIRWKITSIKTHGEENANLQGWQNSHDAITSATGIAPELAAIRTGEKLGAGGSAVKNQFNYTSLKLSPERDLMVKCLYTIKKVNAWPADTEFGALLSELVSTDESKNGKAKEETLE